MILLQAADLIQGSTSRKIDHRIVNADAIQIDYRCINNKSVKIPEKKTLNIYAYHGSYRNNSVKTNNVYIYMSYLFVI